MTEDLYDLSLDPRRVQMDRVHPALATSYWSPGIRRDVLERAVRGSLVSSAFLRKDGLQVAFARAVTDCATFAWLCDVYVDEAHRGAGLGKRVVEALLGHPEIASLRRWALATRDAHGLYRRYGFDGVPTERWMEKRMPVRDWSEG